MALEVFAGPIVRRATVNKVCLWIATKGSPDLEAKLFANQNVIGRGYSKTISLREKLFVHLIEIVPDSGRFPENKLINYSIGIPAGNGYDHGEFKNMVIREKLAYGNQSWYSLEGFAKNSLEGKKPNLPGFFLPSENSMLNIAFGSCRKPHDKGDDAFVKLDSLLESTLTDFSKRPQVLFLGGDQIYADDVDEKYVLPAVIHVAKQLNLTEQLPDSATHTVSYIDRTQIMKNMGFTSGEVKSHLLGFGEYVAMYGLVWNGANWTGLSLGNLADFGQGLEPTRRAMANTPTYMIFDDHDVTDDWFIVNKWKNDVLGNKNGKRIIANAMAAYFLFQGWGNDPDKFNFPKLKKIIEEHVNTGSDKKTGSPFDTHFLGLEWEFSAPTYPVSYFLDTRTKRDGHSFPPILKSKASWDSTKIKVQNKNLPFVLIAASPLVTFPGIDAAQKFAVLVANLQYELDYESWFANKKNYELFFQYCKSNAIHKLVILSGDVHYAFSAVFWIYNKEKMLQKTGGHKIHCVQITSSALKNSAKMPGEISLGAKATVPYSGTLYFLLFKDRFEIACDKKQAEEKLSKSLNKILGGKPAIKFPTYAVANGHIYELKENVILPWKFEYKKLDHSKYPDLVIELLIKSLAPKTADFMGEHNFGLVSLHQNNLEYSFNNGQKYSHTI
jgi:hypothetical protein